MSKTSAVVRQEFIDFFKAKQHAFIRSAPVVPQDDPTLLFTNAGMNQFKTIFLGENRDGLTRVANSQKCMRVSGKHNDLEEVGRDHYHHTFFEMLGNWSFGDYYKAEAIAWAWELLTVVWKLPVDRLFVTIHKSDDEAEKLWQTLTPLAHNRIMRFGDKENFWEMAETGPCGPCTEIHYDIGDASDREATFSDPILGVNGQNARYREIWNLVFMQYNRQKDGSLLDLPRKHVDTGMGFERVTSVIQNVQSNYDTDLFMPIIAKVEELSGRPYSNDDAGTPYRVIADHIRSLTFAITDGAFPSNEGRGYVLRRLLRRAYRFGRELGFKEPFLYKLVPTVVDIMGDSFPEIKERRDYVMQVIENEEQRFGQTLEQGIAIFGQMVDTCKKSGNKILGGTEVFTLYDTYGFPMDLTRLMASEKGISVDEAGFESFMAQQRKRARDAQKNADDEGLSSEGWIELKKIDGTIFTGYNESECQASVARYKVLTPAGATDACVSCLVVLDKTPFYAESGGQIGDTGVLVTASGRELTIENTFKWNDTVVHKVSVQTSFPTTEFSQTITARIDQANREHTRRNHSATHLLQAALRQIAGNHVQQSGSRVSPLGLRFDYTHFRALTEDEKIAVERQVNEWILQDLPVATDVKNIDEAKSDGATALFGEKYGDMVRVVSMGRVSKELCGGTHVVSTGRIGLFHILAEESISAGVRRIEGITGMASLEYLSGKEKILSEAALLLKVNEDALISRITDMSTSLKDLQHQVTALSAIKMKSEAERLSLDAKNQSTALQWSVANLGSMDKKDFAALTDAISDVINEKGYTDMIIAIGAAVDGKALFAACAGQSAVKKQGVHCGELVKAAASRVDGGGGGSPTRASAGGKNVSDLALGCDEIRTILQKKAAS
jgi:alanyl-tRNA synthetase